MGKGHYREVWAVAVTPDSRHAVSGSDDGALKVWDLGKGTSSGPTCSSTRVRTMGSSSIGSTATHDEHTRLKA